MIRDVNGNKEMMFGTGDICVNAVMHNEKGGVIFTNQEAREVGSAGKIKIGDLVYIDEVPVVMMFSKKESIDVVITALQKAKSMMEQYEVKNDISD